MATKGISGIGASLVAAGAFFAYVGIKGTKPLDEIRSILRGETPEPLGTTSKFSGISGSGESSVNPIESGSSANAALLNAAKKYIGRPYVWGGTFAGDGGGDCSGLVWRAMRDIGSSIPRFTTTTILASKSFTRVSGSPAPGDVIVWPGDHMGIVASAGMMLDSPHRGAVVRYESYTGRRAAIFLRPVLATKTNISSNPSSAGTRFIAQ